MAVLTVRNTTQLSWESNQQPRLCHSHVTHSGPLTRSLVTANSVCSPSASLVLQCLRGNKLLLSSSWMQEQHCHCCDLKKKKKKKKKNVIERYIVLLWLLFVGCLTSQQHASVSHGRICSDNFTYCNTEEEAADPTFYLTQSQYTDTGPTSPSAGPITPGAWQGSHWIVCQFLKSLV